jgi:hypothetical protein
MIRYRFVASEAEKREERMPGKSVMFGLEMGRFIRPVNRK